MIALVIGVGWVLATWLVLSFFRGANSDVPTPRKETLMSDTLPHERRLVRLVGVPHRLVVEELPCFDDAADVYEASDDFVTDALQWVSDARDLPGDLVERVLQHYRQSAEFTSVVEDYQAGDR